MPEGAEGEEAAAGGVEEGAAGGALAEVVEDLAGAVIAAADSLQGFVFGAEAGVAPGKGFVDAGDDVGQDASQRDGGGCGGGDEDLSELGVVDEVAGGARGGRKG